MARSQGKPGTVARYFFTRRSPDSNMGRRAICFSAEGGSEQEKKRARQPWQINPDPVGLALTGSATRCTGAALSEGRILANVSLPARVSGKHRIGQLHMQESGGEY